MESLETEQGGEMHCHHRLNGITNAPALLRLSTVLFFTLLLTVPVDVYAIRPARLSAKVVNEKGEPVPGVEVTITHRKQSNYFKQVVTNKKGRFLLQVQAPALFDDCFSLLFKADGYQPLQRYERMALAQSLRAVYTLYPESGADFHNQGVVALRNGDFGGAETFFLRALQVQPGLTPSHHALAELYLRQEEYARAVISAEAARVDPSVKGGALEVLYLSHRALGNSQKAQASLRALAESGDVTTVATYFYNEGVEALKRGDLDSARQKLLAAVKLNPDLAVAYVGLAELEIEAERPDVATEAVARALAIDPDNDRAKTLASLAHR